MAGLRAVAQFQLRGIPYCLNRSEGLTPMFHLYVPRQYFEFRLTFSDSNREIQQMILWVQAKI